MFQTIISVYYRVWTWTSESDLHRRKGAQGTWILILLSLNSTLLNFALFHTVPAGDIYDVHNQWNCGEVFSLFCYFHLRGSTKITKAFKQFLHPFQCTLRVNAFWNSRILFKQSRFITCANCISVGSNLWSKHTICHEHLPKETDIYTFSATLMSEVKD